eukprot:gb/GECG01014389.1/.p1 GENE.gb/GECG01014389.1/~~gb/GECG01014389.1/.p1  ORF type:complete len:432 (+),score=55.34 gb/GECG01014389.1/:1-1296(+)
MAAANVGGHMQTGARSGQQGNTIHAQSAASTSQLIDHTNGRSSRPTPSGSSHSLCGHKRPADDDDLEQIHRCKRLLKNLKLSSKPRRTFKSRFTSSGGLSSMQSLSTELSRQKRSREEDLDGLLSADSETSHPASSAAASSGSATATLGGGDHFSRLLYGVLLPKSKQARRRVARGTSSLRQVNNDDGECTTPDTSQQEHNGNTPSEEEPSIWPPLQNPSCPEIPSAEPSDPENHLCVVLPPKSSRSNFRSTMVQALHEAASNNGEVWLRIGKLLDGQTLVVDDTPSLRYGTPWENSAHPQEAVPASSGDSELPEMLASSLNALCERNSNQEAIVPYSNRAKLYWEPKGSLWLDARALLGVSWDYLEEILGIPMTQLREYIVYRTPDLYEPVQSEDSSLRTQDIQTPRIEVIDENEEQAPFDADVDFENGQ